MFDSTSIMFALAGGLLIGLSATLLLLVNGRVAGISGILFGALLSQEGRNWRLLFLLGLLAGGGLYWAIAPQAFEVRQDYPPLLIVASGLIVGIGTRLGNGCTSGHGVCGIGRLSVRSIAATITFILTGIVTVTLVRWFMGASL